MLVRGGASAMKKWIGIAIIGVLIGIVIYNVFAPEKEATYGITDAGEGLEVGQIPPQFKLQNAQNEEVTLNDFKGQKIILNFWATWCKPCREEMPLFEEIDQAYDDVVVLAINMANQDSGKEKVEQFLKEQNLTFPVIFDETGDVGNAYKIANLPGTYFIDEDGKIMSKVPGQVHEEVLRQHLGIN